LSYFNKSYLIPYEDHEDEEAAAHEDGFIWVEEVDKWVKVD